MKSYKDYCPFNTMNVRHLTLSLSIALAMNSVTSPAQSGELALTSSQFSHFQIKFPNTLKSILAYYRSFPLPINKGWVKGLSYEIEDEVEDQIEDEVENEIEDEVEDEIEDEVEDQIEDEVEDEIEDEVEDQIEDEVEDEIEDEVEDEIEDKIENEVENKVEDEVEDKVEDEVENNIEDKLDITLLRQSEDQLLERVAVTTTAQINNDVSQVIRLEDEKIYSDDWFVLADENSLDQLKTEGYSVSNKEYLDGLGLYLANLHAPKSFVLKPENYANLMALNTSSRAIDVNHLYELAQNTTATSSQNRQVKTASQPQNPVHHRIGIIDSAINQSHPALINNQIITRQFAAQESKDVFAHGTAVASILVGKSKNYRGMLPGQPLWAATVMFSDQTGSQIATTISLVRAIDWLIQSDVDIINMSLTGPDNRLLQIAIKRACNRRIVVVTAAGNNGPAAKPQYPAAYACTLAVTAIDSQNRVYRRAARGEYIDLAAYGVNVLHADAANAYQASSGTSFAAPLITAWLASNLPHVNKNHRSWLKQIMSSAEDLGEAGKDVVYGFGTPKSHPGEHLLNTEVNQQARGR